MLVYKHAPGQSLNCSKVHDMDFCVKVIPSSAGQSTISYGKIFQSNTLNLKVKSNFMGWDYLKLVFFFKPILSLLYF